LTANAHHHANAGPDKGAEQPDVEGNPRAIDEAAEHVTAQLVAAQQQLRSGRRIDESRVGLGGVVRRDKRGKNSDDDQQQCGYGPEGAQGLLLTKRPGFCQKMPLGIRPRPGTPGDAVMLLL
jgi:hypothetical protein